MELKGFFIGGSLVIADDEYEALEMYNRDSPWGRLRNKDISEVVEKNLDETYSYFELKEINKEDHVHIYD